jgi:hypothetical protein
MTKLPISWDRCSCGNPKQGGSVACKACFNAWKRERRDLRRVSIAHLYGRGFSFREIAVEVGTTIGTVKNALNRMRKDGWDIPHRYRAWDSSQDKEEE